MIGIFLDIESNGLDPQKHRAIEIAIKFVDLLDQKPLASYESIIKQSKEVWDRSDPNSLAVNGFTFEKVQPGREEKRVGSEILELFKSHKIHRDSSVYICQNPSFDRAFFSLLIEPEIQEAHQWPYHWLDLASMFWALQLEKLAEGESPPWLLGISKNCIAKTLGIPPEETPHRAMNGVDHLIECYFALNACHQP